MRSSFDIDLPLIHTGKVRRLYQMPAPEQILMVATDHISAFDHILDVDVPGKGVILTQMSLWWFEQLRDVVGNHVLSAEVPEAVRGRGVVVEKLQMVPIEAVARGYLTGSGWKEYQESGTVCGIPLPEGLRDGSRLPEPIFTPAYKAPMGEHDENITFERMVELVGEQTAHQVREVTLACYARGAEMAAERGIIVADTKFEFGHRADGTLVLADEALTCDSSRFWDADDWRNGTLTSFDKQYMRNWLAHDSGWDQASDDEPPAVPAEVVQATRERYLEAYTRLTGQGLDDYLA